MGVEMTTITAPEVRAASGAVLGDRNAYRLNGWAIAIVSSILLWSVSGAALWAIINIVT